MIIANPCYEEMINSVAREIRARVELYESSTLLQTFYHDDALQSFSVERIGDSTKFFGYGICQKATVKLRDKDRAINIVKGQRIEIVVGVGCEYLYTCPVFFVEDVQRNENTNELTITAYDAIYKAREHQVSEVSVTENYTIEEFTHAAAAVLGMPARIDDSAKEAFQRVYPNGANFDGTESIREAFDDIAEATGTIYYMCGRSWCITFKRLDVNGTPVLHIDKSKYFTLTAKEPVTLQNVTHTTELGENVTAGADAEGIHQYIRDNAFIEMYEDVGALVDELLSYVAGLTITPVECKWRGNFLLECGDKISLTTKDDEVIECFVVDDVFTYNGGLSAKTRWEYVTNESETSTNSSNLGDALKQTFARVDKVNKEITMLASDVSGNREAISALKINTDSINASVSELQKSTNDTIDGINEEVNNIKNQVEATMTSEDVTIAIRQELTNGVNKVTTETGFTFDNDGLRVSKSGSEMESLLDEDGLTVFRDDTEVLTADNTGVNCINVTAKQYLIIGDNSRFENYGSNRTGCFWIGG